MKVLGTIRQWIDRQIRNRDGFTGYLLRYRRKFFNELFHYDARFFTGQKSKEEIRTTLVEMLIVLLKEFDKHHITYWLDGGALLGAYRNGRFIPWDNDLDVSTLRDEISLIEKIRAGNERYLFEINPHAYFSWRDHKNTVDARLIDKNTGLYIDIFMYDKINEFTLQEKGYTYNRGKRRYDHVFPLGKIVFENIQVNCPNKVYEYLVAKYGDINPPSHVHPSIQSDKAET